MKTTSFPSFKYVSKALRLYPLKIMNVLVWIFLIVWLNVVTMENYWNYGPQRYFCIKCILFLPFSLNNSLEPSTPKNVASITFSHSNTCTNYSFCLNFTYKSFSASVLLWACLWSPIHYFPGTKEFQYHTTRSKYHSNIWNYNEMVLLIHFFSTLKLSGELLHLLQRVIFKKNIQINRSEHKK